MKRQKYNDNIYFSENIDSKKAVYAEKGVFIVCAITLLATYLVYLVLQIIGYKGGGYWLNLLSLFGAIVCLAIPFVLRRFKLYVNSYLAMFWFLYMILSFYLGINFEVYKMGPFYDKFVHCLCGVLAGLLGVTLMNLDNKFKNKWGIFFATLAFACLVGLCWEIIEFVFDSIFGANSQRFIDEATGEAFVGRDAIYDIMFDLIADFVGGLILAIVFLFIKPQYIKRLAIQPKSKIDFGIKNAKIDDNMINAETINDKNENEVENSK